MRRSVFAMLGAAALVAGAALYGQAHAQKSGVNVGSLTCNVAGGIGFVFGSSKQISCLFNRTDDVFFILAGSVRINSISAKGREVIYSECSAGNIFGEFSAIDGLPRSATVHALTDCVLARMPAASFFELIHSNGPVATKLVDRKSVV